MRLYSVNKNIWKKVDQIIIYLYYYILLESGAPNRGGLGGPNPPPPPPLFGAPDIGYEPASLTVHPLPKKRYIESGFILFA